MISALRALSIEKFRLSSHTLHCVIMFFVMFFLFTPSYITSHTSGAVSALLSLGKYASYGWIVYRFVFKTGEISSGLLMCVLLYADIFIATAVNHGHLGLCIVYAVKFIMAFVLYENEKKDLKTFLKVFCLYLFIISAINLGTLIIHPEGLYRAQAVSETGKMVDGQRAWFLSNKNGMGKYFLFLLTFSAMYDFEANRKLTFRYYTTAIVCLVSIIIAHSSTSIAVTAVSIVLTLLVPVICRLKPKIFNIYVLLAINAVLYVVFVISHNASFFKYIIVDVLQEDMTFNGRTPIWDKAIESVSESPLFGYGYLGSRSFRILIGDIAASDAHNLILTFTVFGGLSALIIMLAIIFTMAKRIRKVQYEPQGVVLTIFLFMFMIMMIFENTGNEIYWIVFACCFDMSRKKIAESKADFIRNNPPVCKRNIKRILTMLNAK